MPPPKLPLPLPLPQPNSPISLSSWALVKYSYSVSSTSTSIQPPWTHFPHRDNLFLVIDSQRVPGYIQNDGKFTDQQARLKVVWGLETLVKLALESLDLTSLAQQTTPVHDFQQFNKPAFVALGRSPSLAIKYYKAEDQTIRRFQVKLLSSAAYQSASALLERANCPVGTPLNSRDDNKYQSSSQVQLCPLVPLFHNVQVLHTPPGTSSGYSSGSASSPPPATLSGGPHSLDNPPTYAHSLTVSDNTTNATSRGLFQPNDAQLAHPRTYPSHSYLHNAATSPGTFPEEDIPPPRPPPSFGSRAITGPMPVSRGKRNVIDLISSLPPLPKPTPLSKAPSMTLSNRNLPAYRGSSFDSSSRPGSGADATQEGANKALTKKERAGTYRPALPKIAEESTKGNNRNNRASVPVFPHGYKKPGSEAHNTLQLTPNSKQRIDIDVTTLGARDTSTGGKRKQGDGNGNDKEERGEPKKQKEDNPHACDEEEFRQIEDFIVNAIHDDDFLKLVERVSGVWQRMGFDEIGQNFFSTSILDR